jgi:excisionase family DNA binding protein
MTDPGRLYTLDEAAAELQVSRRTVEREVKAGRIRVIRIGPARRLVRVADRELKAYLAAAFRAA